MKRRRMIQSVLGVSAASVLPAPLLSQPPAPIPVVDDNAKLVLNAADTVAAGVLRFFDTEGFTALRRLGEILAPARQNLPGAVQAEAAEFLDFLISQSPADRQTLYRDGVAHLNREARARSGKPFADISLSDADAILAPLRQPWTYEPPADPFAQFLRAAKEDFLKATVNSRQWAAAAAGGNRRGSGLNVYWLPIE